MAPRLNLIGATVTAAGAEYLDVQIIVRNDEATVSTVKGVLAQKAEVLAVEIVAPRQRTVRFADGTAWDVVVPERKGGCGCR